MANRLTELKLSLSPALSAKVLGYSPGNLIGHKVLPIMPCGEAGNRLPLFNAGALTLLDDGRALRADAKQHTFTVSYTDVTLDEHTMDVPLDWREVRAGQAVGIDYRARQSRTAKRLVVTRREYNIATHMMTAGNYAAGHSETVGGGAAKWDYKSGGVSAIDVIAVIKAKAAVIRAATGEKPQVFWCGQLVWDGITSNTLVLGQLYLSPSDVKPKTVTQAAFAEAIGVQEVLIGDAVYSSDGATIAGDLWSDAAGLVLKNEDMGEVEAPSYGVLAMEQFGRVGEEAMFGFVTPWLSPSGKVEHFEYCEMYKPWTCMNTAGYLWLDTLT